MVEWRSPKPLIRVQFLYPLPSASAFEHQEYYYIFVNGVAGFLTLRSQR